ncbi:MAG: hypothetical protein IJA83_04795 [Clostridia bacterium]|nr:hypothetical protein [Clostridia bacterium]
MKHRILAFCMLLMLMTTSALAQTPAVNDMSLALMGNSVHYPQLTGLEAAVQTAVNAAIMEKGQINERLARMAALLDAPVKLSVTYDYTLQGDVFSCAILADGAVETSRATQVWSTVNYDLFTGKEITFADLFTDVDAATAFIETYLDEQVAPELSAHLAAGSLTPIPEEFTISPTGLTLYYDIDDFRTLSDKAGTVTILWCELREHLRLDQADPLMAIGAADHIALGIEDDMMIADMLQAGGFVGIPATLGQPMQELIDRYALLTDPDIYEGGRMIALEDGVFRGVYILTDALTEEFDQSVVQGIRADRLNFYGLCTGDTTIDWWREVLGTPDNTLTVTEERAEAWRIVPGTSDYYTFGDYRLRLHADENGVLRSVFLMK